MNTTQQGTLSVVQPDSPMPTVEIDTEERSNFLSHIIPALRMSLAAFARAKPKATATLYLYSTPSFNFGQPTMSAFIAVAGPIALLQRVHATLAGSFHVKFSDYLSWEQATPMFHIQNGVLHEAVDASGWRIVQSEAR
jgi:hypothetical protein